MAFHHSLGRKAITTGLTFAPGDVSALCTHPGFTACGISCCTPQRPYLLPHPLGFRSGRAGHGQHGCAQVFSITVLTLSIYFIRAIAFPKTESLVKQYREAYVSFLCPICEYSIRRGPPKFWYWNRRSIKELSLQGVGAGDENDSSSSEIPRQGAVSPGGLVWHIICSISVRIQQLWGNTDQIHFHLRASAATRI
jgi:hypothetical protein